MIVKKKYENLFHLSIGLHPLESLKKEGVVDG